LNSNEDNPETYQSLNELVIALSEDERTNYSDIIRSMKMPKRVFENCYSWSDEGYTRNCIVENEKFELILICWEKGQATPIHDHGGEECWVRIIQGEFKETIYQMDKDGELNSVKSTISKAGDVSYMVDFMGCHRLENLSDKRGISLHLYAKPIRNCNVFDNDLRVFVNKDLAYSTILEFEDELK
jgi:cysteine dioxygenase